MPTGAASLQLDAPEQCRSCELLAVVDPPPRGRVAVTDHLCVAHAFDAGLEGWLVVQPRRHVVSVAALDEEEARELGPLLRAVSAALGHVVGCAKTYVLQLAESPGFHHVHFHVVPRAADLPEASRGARIFTLLGVDDPVPPDRQDALALAVRAHLVAAGAARPA